MDGQNILFPLQPDGQEMHIAGYVINLTGSFFCFQHILKTGHVRIAIKLLYFHPALKAIAHCVKDTLNGQSCLARLAVKIGDVQHKSNAIIAQLQQTFSPSMLITRKF